MYKKILLSLGLVAMLFCVGCSENTPMEPNTGPNTSEISKLFEEFSPTDTFIHNFAAVCQDVELDPSDINGMEQSDDWSGGARFTFVYHQAPFVLYCNEDSTIDALQIGNDIDVYKRGYEPYHADDFIVPDGEKAELQVFCEDTVSRFLNFPETADFHTMDWGYGRNHGLYHISGSVTAKNAFGVKDKLSFHVVYHLSDSKLSTVYVQVGDSVQVNQLDQFPAPERSTAASDNQMSASSSAEIDLANSLILDDRQLGEYGREDHIGNETYIDFYVPAGTYSIQSLTGSCTVFVIDNPSNESVVTLSLPNQDTQEQITVSEAQHIELTMNAKVALTPIQ